MQKTQISYDPIKLPEEFPVTVPGFTTPPQCAHIHNCFEIGCCYSGTGGVFQIGAKLYSCNPGDVVFINEKEYHLLNEATPENSCWKFLNLDPAALLSGYITPEENIFDTASFSGINFKNVISGSGDPELVELVHILFSELENPDFKPATHIRAIVWAVFSKLRKHSAENGDRAGYPSDDFSRLYPALNYISRFCHKQLEVPHLAEMCSMSVATFRKNFIRHTGMLPVQYINAYRLKVALSLLKNSSEQIVTIAMKSGFPTLSHFNRVFKKEFGSTPAEYRKLSRS
ncbi:MAG: helix-turn-helix transcriptional regulator [Lentisphaeria bacterium]|nr:helix-turn-helix transcriptional regulator [Lentisphaeria bacterium]